MRDKLMFGIPTGLHIRHQEKFPDYLEYIIDTDLPSRAPIANGNADLWVHNQSYYYAIVDITRQYKLKDDPYQVHFEEYNMLVHCDRLLPYAEISTVFQKAITDVIGPANRIFGTIKIYRKKARYRVKENMKLELETPMLNVYQKQD